MSLPAACNRRHARLSPTQSCHSLPECVFLLLPLYWSGAFTLAGHVVRPYRLTCLHMRVISSTACPPLRDSEHSVETQVVNTALILNSFEPVLYSVCVVEVVPVHSHGAPISH